MLNNPFVRFPIVFILSFKKIHAFTYLNYNARDNPNHETSGQKEEKSNRWLRHLKNH